MKKFFNTLFFKTFLVVLMTFIIGYLFISILAWDWTIFFSKDVIVIGYRMVLMALAMAFGFGTYLDEGR